MPPRLRFAIEACDATWMDRLQGDARLGVWSSVPAEGLCWWSSGMFDLHELPRDTAEPPDPIRFFPDGAAATIQSSVDQAVAEHLPWRLELPFVTATGRKRRVVHYGHAECLPSGKLLLRGGLQDVTCHSTPLASSALEDTSATIAHLATIEQLRGALIKSARMSAVGDLTRGLAHQVNNPLLVIQGKAHLILRRLKAKGLDPDALEQDLEKIIAATEQISQMVNNLRSFARQADKDPFRPESLRRILDDTLELWHERLRHAGVLLRVDMASDVTLDCRDLHISQAIFNLLDNAYGAVLGRPNERWIELRVEANAERVSIEISDSGAGVAPEIRDKIMLPFFTTKESSRHEGLGLGIALQIASEHGGHVQHVMGRPHTCFALILPLRRTQEPAKM